VVSIYVWLAACNSKFFYQFGIIDDKSADYKLCTKMWNTS